VIETAVSLARLRMVVLVPAGLMRRKGLLRLSPNILGLAVALAAIICLAWCAPSQAGIDPCLVGTWETPASAFFGTGTATLTIPASDSGIASYQLTAVSSLGFFVYHIPGVGFPPATSAYSVGTPSTPASPLGRSR
jgi:hypothetical protein